MENIIYIIIGAIIQILLNKYLKPILPKKLDSFKKSILSFLLFCALYLSPIILIVFGYIYLEFDRYYVLHMCFSFGLLVFQVSINYTSKVSHLLSNMDIELAKHIEKLEEKSK